MSTISRLTPYCNKQYDLSKVDEEVVLIALANHKEQMAGRSARQELLHNRKQCHLATSLPLSGLEITLRDGL
jgi:hypothetical protein